MVENALVFEGCHCGQDGILASLCGLVSGEFREKCRQLRLAPTAGQTCLLKQRVRAGLQGFLLLCTHLDFSLRFRDL